MVASLCFGRGVGYKKIEKVIEKYPDLLEIKVTTDMLSEVEGFSTKTSNEFFKNIIKFKQFMVEHSFLKLDIPTKKKVGNVFENKKIVMTGFRNNKIIDYILDNGGSITNSISKNTYLLIIKDNNSNSSKKHAAEMLGISIMTQEEFIKTI